jgi:hypothetical protein
MKKLILILIPLMVAGVVVTSLKINDSSTSLPKETGTLQGSMTIGPICPVERIDHSCTPTPEMYAARKVFIYNSDQTKTITTLIPDAEGHFSTTLPVGDYIVDTEHQAIGFSRGTPQNIRIIANQITAVTIDIDTGIR